MQRNNKRVIAGSEEDEIDTTQSMLGKRDSKGRAI